MRGPFSTPPEDNSDAPGGQPPPPVSRIVYCGRDPASGAPRIRLGAHPKTAPASTENLEVVAALERLRAKVAEDLKRRGIHVQPELFKLPENE